MQKRNAFSMIELVFAIVIIGLVVTVVPTMISVNVKNQELASYSEGIFALSAQMMQDSTYYWDDASKSSSSGLGNVLDATTTGGFERIAGTIYRVGHTTEAGTTTHRHFFLTPTVPVGTKLNNSVESREVTGASLDTLNSNYTYDMHVSYVDDTAVFKETSLTAPTTSNIKLLEYKLYISCNVLPIAVMRNYVSNIGEADYYKVLK